MFSSLVRFLKRQIILHVFLFCLFISSGLIVNFLQLLTLIIWPFNKQLYRKLNRKLAYCFWSELTGLAQYWSNTKVTLYIKEEDFKYVNKEHVIVIMNHKYDVDWLIGWIICQKTGLLGGSKIIGKQSLSLVPLIGWCWLFSESIFIKRNWDTDKKLLVEGLDKKLTNYPKDHYFNVLMFCEGTRFTQRKHEESMKIAQEKGFPVLKHHLLPRTKGFSLLARGATGRIDAIYDLTVGIEDKNGARPTFNTIRNGIPLKAEMFVRRIPMKDVPESEEGSAKFIHNLYKEKDEIYDVYHKTGSFKSLGLPVQELPAKNRDYYICLFWLVFIGLPMFYGIFLIITNATIWMNILFILIVISLSFLCEMMINVTKTDVGSHYGLVKDDKALKNDNKRE